MFDMNSAVEYHKFNDDLLFRPEDLELAAVKYPSILHILDHPELRDFFFGYDEAAKRAKGKG